MYNYCFLLELTAKITCILSAAGRPMQSSCALTFSNTATKRPDSSIKAKIPTYTRTASSSESKKLKIKLISATNNS